MDLAAKMVDEPKNQADAHADYQAGDEWKIKSAVLAAMNDVARQTAEAEGKSSAKVEKSADDEEHRSDRKQQASELLRWLHSESVTEPMEGMTGQQFCRSGSQRRITSHPPEERVGIEKDTHGLFPGFGPGRQPGYE